MIQIQCMTAVCIRNLTYSAFENYIKVIKIYGCEKDDGITLNPGIHHIIHNFPSSFFFCAKNKLDWTIRDWTHFFQQKNYMCSNMHKCKKMVFTFDKKNPHNSTIYASWVSFWHCKKYHLYHWDTFKCNLQQKVLGKKFQKDLNSNSPHWSKNSIQY